MEKETIIDLIKKGGFKSLPKEMKLPKDLYIHDIYGNKFYVMGCDYNVINKKVQLEVSSTIYGNNHRININADYFDKSALENALITLLFINYLATHTVDTIAYIFDILWGNETEYVFCVGEKDLRDFLNENERKYPYSRQLALYFTRQMEIELCNRNDYTLTKLNYTSFLQHIATIFKNHPFDAYNIFSNEQEWLLENFESILLD